MDSDSDPNSSDTTFNPIEWWIGKVSTFSYDYEVHAREMHAREVHA
jgi:hypothetical protein